jgi:flagellar basal body-associated protein FliL
MKFLTGIFTVLTVWQLIATPAPAAGAGADAANDRYVALAPVTVSVFRDSRVRGMLSLELTLEVADGSSRERIDKIMPRLRDRYITIMSRLAANRVDIHRPLDLESVTEILQSATDQMLGPQVARVLVGGAMVRRL